MNVFPIDTIDQPIPQDTANLLVDHMAFSSTTDLFVKTDASDQPGYLKLRKDNIHNKFV